MLKKPHVRRCGPWIFLSPSYNKFAVKCDWNSYMSWNKNNYVFFPEKKRCVFSKKKHFFFNFVIGGEFAVECVSHDIISRKCLFSVWVEGFLCRNQKSYCWKNYQNLLRMVWKKFSIFLKVPLAQLEGKKYAGSGRPSWVINVVKVFFCYKLFKFDVFHWNFIWCLSLHKHFVKIVYGF